jgi:hypothetical protein
VGQVTATGTTYSAAGTSCAVNTLAAGRQVTFHIYSTGQAGGVRPFVQDSTCQTVFTRNADTPISNRPGWTTLTWAVTAVATMRAIGLQLTNPDQATTIALDDLTW